jgi:hypothetical protein
MYHIVFGLANVNRNPDSVTSQRRNSRTKDLCVYTNILLSEDKHHKAAPTLLGTSEEEV